MLFCGACVCVFLLIAAESAFFFFLLNFEYFFIFDMVKFPSDSTYCFPFFVFFIIDNFIVFVFFLIRFPLISVNR